MQGTEQWSSPFPTQELPVPSTTTPSEVCYCLLKILATFVALNNSEF